MGTGLSVNGNWQVRDQLSGVENVGTGYSNGTSRHCTYWTYFIPLIQKISQTLFGYNLTHIATAG